MHVIPYHITWLSIYFFLILFCLPGTYIPSLGCSTKLRRQKEIHYLINVKAVKVYEFGEN